MTGFSARHWEGFISSLGREGPSGVGLRGAYLKLCASANQGGHTASVSLSLSLSLLKNYNMPR